ncbi:MAG: MacB family efflux pump subunit [Gammaproteobacteria bacterium]|nr:MacB family efflux pump subunit [Gammaproteobacteria bacterium]
MTHLGRTFSSGPAAVRALDDVTLGIEAGEFVAIMGQSGSGKSTLMHILGCLDRATSGSYAIAGRDVATLDADERATLRRDTFGFVFQGYNLLANATAAENVEIPAIYAARPRRERSARAAALLARLGLSDRGRHRPNELSGGQQQRVAIARALMNDPPVILADEPTGALDSASGQEVLALLAGLNAEGRTIVLITHDAGVAAHARRRIVLKDGRVIDDSGTPATHGQARGAQPNAGRRRAWLAELWEAVKMALRSLRANLFRTALTLLGVVIGVAAVVTMLAIGAGSKAAIITGIQALGTNVLSIRPGGLGLRTSGDVVTLVEADARAIAALAHVDSVSPEREAVQTVRFGSIDYRTRVVGGWPSYPQAHDWDLGAGSFFTEADLKGYAPVIVLGATAAEQLFPDGSSPLGQYVLVRNIPFEVTGVLARKGASPWGSDLDDIAVVPLSTGFMRLFGQPYLNNIVVKVRDAANIDAAEADIEALLRERHRVEDFDVRNTASLLEMVSSTQDTLTVLLGSVAAISLVVGGIGVMNIMLVSVTERTREIGVRMATGARMRDILLQFNTEALVVCSIGGVAGVLLGLAVAQLSSRFGMPVVYTPEPALLAFSCAFLTGLVFGYLPARKAARLDPVIALARE